MNRTKIEYLTRRWDPVRGCLGDGCAVRPVCFARRQAKRMKHRCQQCYDFVPHLHPQHMMDPCNELKPQRVGVCFGGDLFGPGVMYNWQKMVLEIVRMADWHTFVFLTKHPEKIPRDLYWPKNAWLLVTINRGNDLWRLDLLKKHKLHQPDLGKIGVSFEPLYGPISGLNLESVDWIIIGAQTRPEIQPAQHWVRDLTLEATRRGTAVWYKDNLAVEPKVHMLPGDKWDPMISTAVAGNE